MSQGRYRAYPDYRNSGVELLGTVPKHWNVFQLKRSVEDCVNGIWGAEPINDGKDTIVLRVADFSRATLSINSDGYTYRRIEEKEKLRRRLKRGDLLLEKSGGGEKTLVGQVVLFDGSFDAVTSNFVAKMTPAVGFDSRFLNYTFSRFYDERINYCSIKQNTGIQNLDSEAYLSEKFCFPPLPEQIQIAKFLDHETAKIDRLIERQEALIRLLKEKRQAVISHAVTKGLNPHAPLKDSGIEWLGQVPAHWRTIPLKLICQLIDGDRSSAYPNDKDLVDSGVPFVSSKNIIEFKLTRTDLNYITPQKFASLSRGKLQDGDLVITVRGTIGHVGVFDSAIIGFPTGFINAQMMILRPAPGLTAFLQYVSESTAWKEQLDVLAYGSTVRQLSNQVLGNVMLALPPEAEVPELVAELHRRNATFERLIGAAQVAIELIQERRTALISAAVTGKIDVRNWQPPAA